MFALGRSVVFDDTALTTSDPGEVSASQTPNQCGPVAEFSAPTTRGIAVICGPRFFRTSSGTSDASPYSRAAYWFNPLAAVPNNRNDSNLSAPPTAPDTSVLTSNFGGTDWFPRHVAMAEPDAGF